MSFDAIGHYIAPPADFDFNTPRIRNWGLLAISIATGFKINPILGLGIYFALFGFINCDMINRDEKGKFRWPNIRNRDLVIKPILQPFKDVVNGIKLRRISI